MDSVEAIKKKISELEEVRRMAEINIHRADAAIWALKSVLGEVEAATVGVATEDGKGAVSGDNK